MEKPAPLQHKSLLIPIIGIVVAILLLAFAWRIATRPTQAEIDTFIRSEVNPALDAYATRNKAAVDSAVTRISNGLEAYKKGIKPFVEDITSWGTRFGVTKRLGNDLGEKWWGDPANATEVNKYVTKKFERLLFSEADLYVLVSTSLKQFRGDITASQNKLHADVKTAWDKTGHEAHELNLAQLTQQANANMAAASSKMAKDSAIVGVCAFFGGCVLEDATTTLVRSIIARVATSIATSSATTTASGGGVTATTTTAGGEAGAVGGPGGALIGAGVGLVVGIVADWWMTGKLESKLTSECGTMIDDIRLKILVGRLIEPGLMPTLTSAIGISRNAEEQAIRAELLRASR